MLFLTKGFAFLSISKNPERKEQRIQRKTEKIRLKNTNKRARLRKRAKRAHAKETDAFYDQNVKRATRKETKWGKKYNKLNNKALDVNTRSLRGFSSPIVTRVSAI
ncbi:MAG: hypothetical protein HOE90_24320 [Bacteriovoracaceae bacterium]|nr:hypothetical protein [Bacteriovoracaceae bacterium]